MPFSLKVGTIVIQENQWILEKLLLSAEAINKLFKKSLFFSYHAHKKFNKQHCALHGNLGNSHTESV